MIGLGLRGARPEGGVVVRLCLGGDLGRRLFQVHSHSAGHWGACRACGTAAAHGLGGLVFIVVVIFVSALSALSLLCLERGRGSVSQTPRGCHLKTRLLLKGKHRARRVGLSTHAPQKSHLGCV